MTRFVPRSALLVGAGLVVATLVGLAVSQGGPGGAGVAAVVVVGVGFVKAWLVLHWFMELDTAPATLRRSIDGLLAALAIGLVGVLVLA